VTLAKAWNGTRYNDHFFFTDTDTFDFVSAGGGNDVISDVKDGKFWSDDVYRGQAGNDTLTSTGGYDILRGGCGNDVFKVTATGYDRAAVPGTWEITAGSDVTGFDVEVFGVRGHDLLIIKNSEGYSIEQHGGAEIIHTAFGGTITVRGVEEIHFL